jgi:hypothetical protein
MKFVESVNFLGASDRLAELQFDQAANDRVAEHQADKEGSESSAESAEGDVLKNIQGFPDLHPVQERSEL